jgi:hypothetical protein
MEVFNLKQKEKWNNALSQLPSGLVDIYHTPEYYEVYEKNGYGESVCFTYQEGDKIAVYPFLKRCINNLDLINLHTKYFDIEGVYGYNGVISNTKDFGFRQKFYSEFSEYCKNNNVIAEFTRFHPILKNQCFSQDFMDIVFDRPTIFFDLRKPYPQILKEYSRTNRKMIRWAKGKNVKIKLARDDFEYENFIELYLSSMTKLDAEEFYFFNKKYFNDLNDLLDNNLYLFSAWYEGSIICQVLIMRCGEYLHGHLSGRDRKYAKIPSNNLIFDYIVKFAQKIGGHYFHIGGGRTNADDDSLFAFKKNFSPDRGSFYIGKKIHNQQIYTEICNKWQQKFPEKAEKYNSVLLKYWY